MVHTLGALVFFAYTPSLAILWYIYHRDRIEPEPKRWVAITFLIGATSSVIVTLFIEQGLISIAPETIYTIPIIAAIVEEPAKALAIRTPYIQGEMDGIMDGVVYGGAAGLGFAATENLIYGIGFGTQVTIFRGFLTPLAHSAWTILIGVGFGLRSEGKSTSLVKYYFLAIMLHFSWNYVLVQGRKPIDQIISIFIILVNFGIIKHYLRKGEQEDLYEKEY